MGGFNVQPSGESACSLRRTIGVKHDQRTGRRFSVERLFVGVQDNTFTFPLLLQHKPMTDKSISVENLGPIEHFEFSGSKPGVTVFSGPNGVGKTIFGKAVQAAAQGKGKVPLRDGAKRGSVEAFGATITIGGTCRHTGSFEVLSLDGRFNLADLVDPRIDTPALADNARFKALIGLTGVKADPALFRNHKSFADSFDAVVDSTSIETEDLVEMARKVKKFYDDAALLQERLEQREQGQAAALVAPADLDLQDECDAAILQEAYNEARDEVTRLQAQVENAERDRKRSKEASELLQTLQHEELTAERDTLQESIESAADETAKNLATIDELRKQAQALQARNKVLAEQSTTATTKLEGIARQLVLVQQASEIVTQAVTKFPTDEQVAEAAKSLTVARESVERGTLIRQAIKDQEKAAQHRTAASTAAKTAATYRDAAKATDEVLSASIDCKQLRVESDGKSARLFTDTPERGKTLYHELSDGQKYKIAIDIGADQVGEGGLLTVDQIGWEGIDADNRIAIDRHAKERGVHIWVLEASREVGAPRQIVARAFDETPITKAIVKEAAKILSDEAKPKAEAKPAYKPVPKPLPKPLVDYTVTEIPDSDEIPF